MAVDYNMPILIVDDYRTMLKIIRNLLKQLGFTNVEEATDGSEALGKLREGEFDLVISDWNMEPMTGLQLLKEVRADDRLRAVPFHNHYSREQDRERCCGKGSRSQQLYRQAIQCGDSQGQTDQRPGAVLTPSARTVWRIWNHVGD